MIQPAVIDSKKGRPSRSGPFIEKSHHNGPDKALQTGASPEVDLVLLCARTHLDAEQAGQINALLEEQIDWAHIINMASLHKTLPLLYRNLSTIGRDAVPPSIMTRLRTLAKENAQRSLYQSAELLRLLHLLEAHGILVLPFKGPILASSIYGNLSLRQAGDLDILVRKRDFLRAKDVLIGQGFRIVEQRWDLRETDRLNAYHAYTLVHEDGGSAVDLQWNFSGHFAFFDMDALWKRLKPISFSGKMVLSPPKEVLLMMLGIHGAKHCWGRLQWICDIAEVIRRHQDMDWGRMLDQAHTQHQERILLTGLYLAQNLLGIALPHIVVQRMQTQPMVNRLAAKACDRFKFRACHPIKPLEYIMTQFRYMEHPKDKIQYLHRLASRVLAPSVKDQELVRLPDGLSFLYSLIRPVRLLRAFKGC